MKMNHEGVVVAYMKALAQHSPAEAQENHSDLI
jgi:hypothetical protein